MSSHRLRLLAYGKKTTAYCSLFLQILRCFNSLGALSEINLSQLGLPEGVSPFGNFRIAGCLAPPRNLSQLGHVLHRFFGAKASSVCSSSFQLRKTRNRISMLFSSVPGICARPGYFFVCDFAFPTPPITAFKLHLSYRRKTLATSPRNGTCRLTVMVGFSCQRPVPLFSRKKPLSERHTRTLKRLCYALVGFLRFNIST